MWCLYAWSYFCEDKLCWLPNESIPPSLFFLRWSKDYFWVVDPTIITLSDDFLQAYVWSLLKTNFFWPKLKILSWIVGAFLFVHESLPTFSDDDRWIPRSRTHDERIRRLTLCNNNFSPGPVHSFEAKYYVMTSPLSFIIETFQLFFFVKWSL